MLLIPPDRDVARLTGSGDVVMFLSIDRRIRLTLSDLRVVGETMVSKKITSNMLANMLVVSYRDVLLASVCNLDLPGSASSESARCGAGQGPPRNCGVTLTL